MPDIVPNILRASCHFIFTVDLGGEVLLSSVLEMEAQKI